MTELAAQRVQLHRALSKLGYCSRTVAWEWIAAGQVRVNGRVVRQPLTWITLPADRIEVDSGPAKCVLPGERIVLAMHKPAGYVTTRSDERGRKTVYDLLPADLPWVFPAGRLDADSEGLLILTNDSRLSDRLTSPRMHLPKAYLVTVAGQPAPAILSRLRTGVELDDGRTRPALVTVQEAMPGRTVLQIVLTEGRNRQIRRMCAETGHPVQRLIRVAIAGFPLGNLPAGEVRRLAADDVQRLYNTCGIEMQ